jgi:hypothetical protein
MPREGDSESNKDIGVLHCGKRFRYSKRDIVVEREEKKSALVNRDPSVVL